MSLVTHILLVPLSNHQAISHWRYAFLLSPVPFNLSLYLILGRLLASSTSRSPKHMGYPSFASQKLFSLKPSTGCPLVRSNHSLYDPIRASCGLTLGGAPLLPHRISSTSDRLRTDVVGGTQSNTGLVQLLNHI